MNGGAKRRHSSSGVFICYYEVYANQINFAKLNTKFLKFNSSNKLINPLELVPPRKLTKITPIAYGLVGVAVFAMNGHLNSHPYLQIYLVLLEAKLGIVFVYLISRTLGKKQTQSTRVVKE